MKRKQQNVDDSSDLEFMIIKIPNYISEEWNNQLEQASKSSQTVLLGEIDQSNDSKKAKLTLTQSNNPIPQFYSIDFRDDFAPMAVFSHSENQETSRWEGNIGKFADVYPMRDEKYDMALKTRIQANQSEEKRQIQIADLDEIEEFNRKSQPTERIGVQNTGKRKKRQRYKMNESSLENLILELFEKKDSYTRIELLRRTDQPTDYLRTMLNRLCNEERGKYTLKPEYSLQTSITSTEDQIFE